MYSINVDDKQFEFIHSRGVSIIPFSKDCKTLEPGEFIQIVCGKRTLIAEFYKDYKSFEEIPEQKKECCFSPKTAQSNENIWLNIFAYNTENSESTAIVPATLLLYRNIQWLRHLELKKYLFIYTPTADTKSKFNMKIEVIEQTISFLNGSITVDTLCEKLSEDTDDSYNFKEIIELLHVYPTPPKLNDFRKERLAEISDTLNKIKQLYSKRKYQEIRQAAYDIHNVPEIIRTMNDYR